MARFIQGFMCPENDNEGHKNISFGLGYQGQDKVNKTLLEGIS